MNHIRLLVLLFILPLSIAAWAQCAEIYQRAETKMQKKDYRGAIADFEKAKKCDAKLASKCDAQIKVCREHISPNPNPTPNPNPVPSTLSIEPKELSFGYETMEGKEVKVKSTPEEWTVASDVAWCKPVRNGNRLIVTCERNTTVGTRTAVVTVRNGKVSTTVNVAQEGMEESISIEPEQLEFKNKGEIKELYVHTNTEWEVAEVPEWCEILAKNDDKLILKVEKTKNERSAVITLKTRGGKLVSGIVYQGKKKLFNVF